MIQNFEIRIGLREGDQRQMELHGAYIEKRSGLYNWWPLSWWYPSAKLILVWKVYGESGIAADAPPATLLSFTCAVGTFQSSKRETPLPVSCYVINAGGGPIYQHMTAFKDALPFQVVTDLSDIAEIQGLESIKKSAQPLISPALAGLGPMNNLFSGDVSIDMDEEPENYHYQQQSPPEQPNESPSDYSADDEEDNKKQLQHSF